MGKKPTNTRMTWLRFHKKNGDWKDFCLKAVDSEQTRKGIGDGAVGRYILFWGKITESGMGLCVNEPKWGEYALLPDQYNKLLLG